MCLNDPSRPTGTRIVAVIQLLITILSWIGLVVRPPDYDNQIWIMISVLVYIIVNLVMAFFLLISSAFPTSIHHRRFLRVWLAWTGICAICMLISIMAMLVLVFIYENHPLGRAAEATAPKSVLSLVVQCGLISIVSSHYESIRQTKDRPVKPTKDEEEVSNEIQNHKKLESDV